jgi:hypothetical protein
MTAFVQNPIVIMASYVLTIFAVIFGVYSYVRTRRISRITYYRQCVNRFGQESTNFLTESSAKKITTRVFYTDGEKELEFKKARVDEINLANRGTEVILGANIIEADPLTIKAVDGKIIDFEILGRSNPVNGVQVKQADTGELLVTFEFLNPRDGFAIRVLHSSEKMIGFSGGVIGAETKDAERDLGVSGIVAALAAFCFGGTLLGALGLGLAALFGRMDLWQHYGDALGIGVFISISLSYIATGILAVTRRAFRDRLRLRLRFGGIDPLSVWIRRRPS